MRKIHPRFPEYEVSSDGRVFRISARDGRGRLGELRGRVLKSGYRQFKLVEAGGRQVLIRANRLIAETFIGPPPSPEHQAAHDGGNRLNNAVSNLRWATPKENNADLDRHGTRLTGHKVPNAKLSEDQLREVRAAFTGKRGEISALARRYGTGTSTMNRIVRGLSYCRPGQSALDKRMGA